jgi:hypothetical protein
LLTFAANGQGHHTTSSIAEEECEELTHEVQSRNKSAEDSEEDKDEDDTKQHLNVVFIGHVGKNPKSCYVYAFDVLRCLLIQGQAKMKRSFCCLTHKLVVA